MQTSSVCFRGIVPGSERSWAAASYPGQLFATAVKNTVRGDLGARLAGLIHDVLGMRCSYPRVKLLFTTILDHVSQKLNAKPSFLL